MGIAIPTSHRPGVGIVKTPRGAGTSSPVGSRGQPAKWGMGHGQIPETLPEKVDEQLRSRGHLKMMINLNY